MDDVRQRVVNHDQVGVLLLHLPKDKRNSKAMKHSSTACQMWGCRQYVMAGYAQQLQHFL